MPGQRKGWASVSKANGKNVEHAERIERVIKRLTVRAGNLQQGDAAAHGDGEEHAWEAVEWRNPLTALIEAEDRAKRDLDEETAGLGERLLGGLRKRMRPSQMKAEIFRFITEQVGRIAFEKFDQFLAEFVEWVMASGMHPLDVLKRWFAFVKYKRADLLLNAGFRDLGELLFERGATTHARCRALFGEAPAGWKKTATAREAMRASAIGNQNRRGGLKAPEISRRKKQPTKKTDHES
jgi:hypothetical protein